MQAELFSSVVVKIDSVNCLLPDTKYLIKQEIIQMYDKMAQLNTFNKKGDNTFHLTIFHREWSNVKNNNFGQYITY